MALPKILIRALRPYMVLLALTMAYLAFHQLKTSEEDAQTQSQANINIASNLLYSQIEAAVSKLYLLDELASAQTIHDQSAIDVIAKQILSSVQSYDDIIFINHKTHRFHSMKEQAPTAPQLSSLTWTPMRHYADMIWISSLYEKQPNLWVFAVKHRINSNEEVWLEFNLLGAAQHLQGLRTLQHGYTFVVDRATGRLVFHPNPARIGTTSISYSAGISDLIDSGVKFGTHEYYYKNQFKMSVFSADNALDWVFISGTNRSDILARSYQFSLAGIVIASLLVLAVIANYLIYQINISLANLNSINDIAEFKHSLKQTLDRFCYHNGMQFCLYDSDGGHFSTIDYHGNTHIIHTSKELAKRYTPNTLSYLNKQYADPLAKKLKVDSRHYSIPLFDHGNLIAVLYIKAAFPTYRSILRMIRDYSEVALTNLLLHKQLRSKDVMTHLDNKLTIRDKIDQQLHNDNIYLAILDIDHFKAINDQNGHLCGDAVIMHTADMMKKSFPRPGAFSLARYGGEEFCILFTANDENHAYDQCDMLRHMIETSKVEYGENSVQFTVSIGITLVRDSQHASIGQADKALYQAKGLGRNQVVLNTFAR